MRYFLYEVYDGEEVLCQAFDVQEANEIMDYNFDGQFKFICPVNDYTAEISGLDVY